MLNHDKTPMIFWDGLWSLICGHYFWDNEVGATKFCEKLGYTAGNVLRTGEIYSSDSFSVGKCKENDDWPNCSERCNDYKLGGKCSTTGKGNCDAGQSVNITITCSGGFSASSSSCHGI